MKKMIQVTFELPATAQNAPLIIQYRGTDDQVHYWNVSTTKIQYSEKEVDANVTKHR